MIKEFRKTIIMAVVLLALIIVLVVVLTSDIDLGLFKNLAVASISEKKVTIETLIENETKEKQKHETARNTLEVAKNQYELAKEKFDNIDESTIETVKEATTDEKYFIEYLWIVLGNYATDNGLKINIITPGSTTAADDSKVNVSVASNSIKIIVRGRYANVADFVYEVENDKELKFKLDNIKMSYVANNSIEATFNVLSLQVKK